MVIAAKHGLHLASPAGAERPLTCPRGLLGSEAGLPGAVTQRPTGEGRAGPWMAQRQGRAMGRAPGLQEMPRMSARGAGRIEKGGRLARREAQRRLRGIRRKAKGLVPPFPTQRPRLGKALGDDNGMTNRSFKIEARQIVLVLRNSAFLHEVLT